MVSHHSDSILMACLNLVRISSESRPGAANNIGFVGPDQLVLFDFGLASLWKHGDARTDDEPRTLTGETGSLR